MVLFNNVFNLKSHMLYILSFLFSKKKHFGEHERRHFWPISFFFSIYIHMYICIYEMYVHRTVKLPLLSDV